MARRLGPIAQEIEGAIANLLGPKTKWVQRMPVFPGESCAVFRYDHRSNAAAPLLSLKSLGWLDDFTWTATQADHLESYGVFITDFNDTAVDRREVWLMLEEALDEAISEGV